MQLDRTKSIVAVIYSSLLLALFIFSFDNVQSFPETTSLVRTVRHIQEIKKPLIPQRLWFDAYLFEDYPEKKYAENVRKTVTKYKIAWNVDTVKMVSLSAHNCKNAIMKIPLKGASTDLLKFHLENDPQRHVCRIAMLFLYGGYFLQEELEVIEPYIPSSDNISLAAVINPDNELFNGPFLASAPHHPILYRALKKYILLAKGELKLFTTSRFGEIMRSSFREVTAVNPESKSDMAILSEEQLDKLQQHNEYKQVKKQDGVGPHCNNVIIDLEIKKTYFYTRFPGAHKHQCDDTEPTKPQVPKILEVKQKIPEGMSAKPQVQKISEVEQKIPEVMSAKPQAATKIVQVVPTIPHKLWFASRFELSDLQKGDHKHYANILNTIQVYQKAWDTDEVDYEILDYEICKNAISKVSMTNSSSALVEYYTKESEDFPNAGFDICSAAVLLQNGGYFFNEEVEVVEPCTAKNNNITFMGVKSLSGLFLPSFAASIAEHPVMREVITKYTLLSQGKLSTVRAHPGGEIYRDSYDDQKEDITSKSVLLLEKHLTMLDEEYKTKSTRTHKCNYVIYDPDLKKINFFTRMYVDGEYCAGA